MRLMDKVNSITFKIMSPELVRTHAVVNIINPELYDVDGYPIEGGLMDPRMGVIDPGIRCRTCGGKVKECTGHFGTIELARPVIHYEFNEMIYNILRGTCQCCGRLMVDDEVTKKYEAELKSIFENKGYKAQWLHTKKIVSRLKTKKVCPHCNAEKGKIIYQKPTRFFMEKTLLTPIDIREWLEMVRSEDCFILGLDPDAGRPEWVILNVVSVPPVTVRPSITLEGGQRSEDDLTHKLGDIVRTNQRLYENLNAGAPSPIIEDLWLLLQYHVTTFFDNEVSQIPPARHRSGRPLRTLTNRLKGKDGRFRRNLAGKRVNFSARTVISPDPSLEIDEVGVPFEVAKELTIPERINEWNLSYLTSFVKNGPHIHPGANYVITSDGKRKRITDQTKSVILEELEPGYIVERHLIDGDHVLFNRQPSLHKMSIMAHRAKILPGKTFRLNLSTTEPYNADFDGDEMNLHLPQTEEARAEASVLMNVPNMILSPRHGTPIIGAIQDHVSGCFILTSDDTVLKNSEAFQLLFTSGLEASDLPFKKEYSGKELFSVLLPDNFNFEREGLVVKNGVLLEGSLESRDIGRGGLFLQKFFIQFGPEKTAEFIQRMDQLGIHMLKLRGFSMKLSDIALPNNVQKQVNKLKNDALLKVQNLILSFESKKLVAHPGRTLRETLELMIVGELNKARNKAISLVKIALDDRENDAMIMVKTRAKGSMLNIGMMNAFNGQTSLRGSRINKGYSGRVLPHFKKDDLGAKSHGFIENGFVQGLNPFEFFFAAITGRSSLMDKSMATPKSGYLQRRLINALQDLKVVGDGSVRDDWENVIQFLYGDDGFDAVKKKSFEVSKKL
ncbi:MAG: DNA-directed RNA polymerase subunit A' [Nanoarchaeota archaeon]|nr:DNA-directed RNA polymerase subunit A' [Nanoarchaeota archaeon]